MSGESFCGLQKLAQRVPGKDQLWKEMVARGQRELVILTNLPIRIEQALEPITTRVDKFGGGKQLDGVAERRRNWPNPPSGWIVHTKVFKSTEDVGDESTVTGIEHIEAELVDIRVLGQVFEEPCAQHLEVSTTVTATFRSRTPKCWDIRSRVATASKGTSSSARSGRYSGQKCVSGVCSTYPRPRRSKTPSAG